MIILSLVGGLGNQMFEYAFFLALQSKFPKRRILFENCNTREKLKHLGDDFNPEMYQFQLDCFGISPKWASPLEILWCKYRLLPKFLIRPFHKPLTEKFAAVFQKEFLEIPKKSTYIAGLFQSAKYFQDIEEKVKEAFTLKIPLDSKNTEVLKEIVSGGGQNLLVCILEEEIIPLRVGAIRLGFAL